MNFGKGDTGIGQIHYGFHKSPNIDVAIEMARITEVNSHLPRRTEWKSRNNDTSTLKVNKKRKSAAEKRYEEYRDMRNAGYTVPEIADKLDVSINTLLHPRYARRYREEKI